MAEPGTVSLTSFTSVIVGGVLQTPSSTVKRTPLIPRDALTVHERLNEDVQT